jgi:hypothetical protein
VKSVNEKRSYYRIKDIVGLSYTVVEAGAAESSQGMPDLDAPLASLLAEIDRDFNKVTNVLWQENPIVAKALGLLNRKLALVASHSLPATEQAGSESYEEMVVSLSGSGLGFDCPEPLPAGTKLALVLVLKPSNICLRLNGTVTGLEIREEEDTATHWVRVAFDEGDDAAREHLIQHIVQRQSVQIVQGELVPPAPPE